jgi:hypothetical protein
MLPDKYISISQLKKVFELLEDDLVLSCNQVGNFAIFNLNGAFEGFINLAEAQVGIGSLHRIRNT